jgi:hypothetical protein
MAEKNNPQEDVRLLREEKGLLNDILNFLKKQQSARNDLQKSQTEANRIQKEFNSLIEQANRATSDRIDDLDATAKIQKQITREKILQGDINATITRLQNDGSVAALAEAETYENLQTSTKGITANLERQLKSAKELDKYGGFYKGFAKFVDKIPGLSALKGPFQEAAKASRASAASQKLTEKGVSKTRAGLAGAKKLMSPTGGFVGLALILVDLFFKVDERVTNLAKNLGISKSNARELDKILTNAALATGNMSINSKALGTALSDLKSTFGASIPVSEELLTNQAFLTESLKLSGEQASNLSFLFSAFGGSATAATDSVFALNKSLLKQNGFYISSKFLLKEIASTSAEIQGYFGFSEKALARAVYQTRKFGISLSTANGIASSLLDFETSLSNELKLELLTNQSLNFERARALAFTGDIAGASAEVLKQTQRLTAEQRKNPIILKAAADASGVSVEELNRSFIIQKRLNLGAKEYNRLIKRGSALMSEDKLNQLLMTSKTKEEYENTLSVQEKFSKIIEKVTEKLSTLISLDVIDNLINGAAAFITALASGKSFYRSFGAFSDAAGGKDKKVGGSGEYDDFTIRANPKDTLVMAGGTKLGSETNVLLKELITAVKTGGDVYIDGAKVGSSLVMAKTKLS